MTDDTQFTSELQLAHTIAKQMLGHEISDEQALRAVNSCKSDATDRDDEAFYDALKVYFNN